MILYGELTKVEPQADGSIKVYGVASSGARDSAGEVVTPDAMRAALPDYLAFGAIREMHEPRAAGAALSAHVDDEGVTRVEAHIVDPVAVTKVKAGVYKGLSIGGKVLARDADDATVITRIRLDEISLVDRPCNPEAVIDLWKAQAPTNDQVLAEAERLAKAAGKPGRRSDFVVAARKALTAGHEAVQALDTSSADMDPAGASPVAEHIMNEAAEAPHGSFADPLGAKYPLDTPERIRAAWSAINAPANRAGYDDEAVAAIQARIAAAWRAKIDAAGPPSTAPSIGKSRSGDDLQKLADLESALCKAHEDAAGLSKLIADQAREIERLLRQPLPPRAAGSSLAKAVAKEEDGRTAIASPLSSDQIARALDAMPAQDRAHLLMKAALSRPIPL